MRNIRGSIVNSRSPPGGVARVSGSSLVVKYEHSSLLRGARRKYDRQRRRTRGLDACWGGVRTTAVVAHEHRAICGRGRGRGSMAHTACSLEDVCG